MTGLADSSRRRPVVAFVIPASGGSGGTHSVMQESNEMLQLGIEIYIVCDEKNHQALRENYRDMQCSERILFYRSAEDLADLLVEKAVTTVVCTVSNTPSLLAEAISLRAGLSSCVVAYYIQDYEPLFHEYGTRDWKLAYDSYSAVRGARLFAKTDWIADTVERNHGVAVQRVLASVDHQIFYPSLDRRLNGGLTTRVVAMLRPSTPRRAPKRTAAALRHLRDNRGGSVEIITFGCSERQLEEYGLRIDGVEHKGYLGRSEVADLLRETSLFLDLSDYQAFGRTAIEAMACGAIPIVPIHGGAHEFARHLHNSFIVDTRDERSIVEAMELFIEMSWEEKFEMSMSALETASKYSVRRAVISELSILLR